MKEVQLTQKNTPHPSGFSILFHSSLAKRMIHLWSCLNALVRPLISLLSLFMLAVALLILGTAIFANQYLPGWSDEIFMIDPAYYRVNTGIWQSRVAWDSINTIPYAPNYPLFINFLRIPIAIFGVDFHILRGSIFVIGLLAIIFLLVFFKRKRIFQTRFELIFALFSVACFTAFYPCIYVRPEAVLLAIATFLLFAWMSDRFVLLFLIALLVPLCGLQWNILLLPVVFHWLIFGGKLRKHFLVAFAFALTTVATLVTYHLLGMWPSYLQEAARVGGLNAVSHTIYKLHNAFIARDFRFLTNAFYPYDALPGDLLFLFGGVSILLGPPSAKVKKVFVFSACTYYGVIFAVALFGSLNPQYPKLLLIIPAFAAPIFFRQMKSHASLLLLSFVLMSSYIAFVHWHKIRDEANHLSDVATDVSSAAPWVDSSALKRNLRAVLSPEDIVCCESPSYFAARSTAKEMMPLVFAFDLSPEQFREITVLILQDEPYRIFDRDRAFFRKSSFAANLQAIFWDPAPPEDIDLWEFAITPEDLLSTIASHWHCTFTEIPLPITPKPNTIQFRIFRPSFHPS